jgi:predicted PurR-regulated permease PerM
LDAIRTVWFEVNIFKGIKDEDWDFFFKAPSEAIEKLEENYYASYRLDVNLSLSILLVGIIEALCLIFGAFSFNVPIGIVDIILIIFLIFFLRDGYVLWRDMKRFLKEWRQTKEAITNANK